MLTPQPKQLMASPAISNRPRAARCPMADPSGGWGPARQLATISRFPRLCYAATSKLPEEAMLRRAQQWLVSKVDRAVFRCQLEPSIQWLGAEALRLCSC